MWKDLIAYLITAFLLLRQQLKASPVFIKWCKLARHPICKLVGKSCLVELFQMLSHSKDKEKEFYFSEKVKGEKENVDFPLLND